MDKVIIYGAFEFLGFHFCNRFLVNGCCVKGVHFNMVDTEYLDEKRLEVGRNANFEEISIEQSEVLIGSNDGPAFIIFPLYDLFMTNHVSILTNKAVCDPIFHLLNQRKEQNDKIVYLLPIHLIAASRSSEGIAELEEFLTQTAEITPKGQFFYLPTVFGPWQPSNFLFQSMLSNQSKADKELIDVREWVLDAIFIEDVLPAILEIIETKKEGRFLLESGIADSWNQCADILNIEQRYRGISEKFNITAEAQVTRLPLTSTTPCHESLSIQREHYLQIMRRNE